MKTRNLIILITLVILILSGMVQATKITPTTDYSIVNATPCEGEEPPAEEPPAEEEPEDPNITVPE